MNDRVILITNCSNRKRGECDPRLHARDLPKESIEAAASAWADRIRESKPVGPAADVYCGRGMGEILAASELLGARLMVISAGLGLVDGHQDIPNYDLTVTGNVDSNILRNCGVPTGAPIWWATLSRANGDEGRLKSLLQRSPAAIAVLAVSNPYLQMLGPEIGDLTEDESKRLRIISHYSEDLGKTFGRALMPYTSNFDGPSSPRPGTKSDFAQRAAFHFCTEILSHASQDNQTTHWHAVHQRVSGLPTAPRIERRKLSDEDIMKLIAKLWSDAEGKSGRMLRLLRDQEQVACEQSRFKGLFWQVASELEQLNG